MRKIDNISDIIYPIINKYGSYSHYRFHNIKINLYGTSLEQAIRTRVDSIGIESDLIFPYVSRAIARNDFRSASYVQKILNKDIDKLGIREKLIALENNAIKDVEHIIESAGKSIGGVYAIDGIFLDCSHSKGETIIHGSPVSLLTKDIELANIIYEESKSKDKYLSSLKIKEIIYLNKDKFLGIGTFGTYATYEEQLKEVLNAKFANTYNPNRGSINVAIELIGLDTIHYQGGLYYFSFDLEESIKKEIHNSLNIIRAKFVKHCDRLLGSKILIESLLDISINKKKALINAKKGF